MTDRTKAQNQWDDAVTSERVGYCRMADAAMARAEEVAVSLQTAIDGGYVARDQMGSRIDVIIATNHKAHRDLNARIDLRDEQTNGINNRLTDMDDRIDQRIVGINAAVHAHVGAIRFRDAPPRIVDPLQRSRVVFAHRRAPPCRVRCADLSSPASPLTKGGLRGVS